MSHDSTKKTIVVALGVCLVCSVLVSTAAVGLSSIQEKNKKLDKIQNILSAGDIEHTSENAEELYSDKVKPVVIELATGNIIDNDNMPQEIKPENFDIKKLADDPNFGVSIDSDKDIADIKKRPKNMVIYEVVNKEGNVDKYIFPIYGKGLWSTMYGFIALGQDLKEVKGFTFYEHGETPGLGGEVDNPSWKESWKGKQALNENGDVIIEVIKGKVDPSSNKANHQIDGLSGATITTRGVDKLVRYWLGEEGYASFIENMKKDGDDEKI